MNRNKNLYCHYHQDHGHTTENCRNLWDHLEQLVRDRRLKHLLHHSSDRGGQSGSAFQGNAALKPPLDTINIIFAALGRTGSYPSRVMSVSSYSDDDPNSMPKRIKTNVPLVLSFLDADKLGTIQPHDDALVVTLRIGGYNVKRVMIDQGSAAEIMYPDLYKGLGLKHEDLVTYSSPLVSFEGKMVVHKGQIRLPVQAGEDMVEVDFIVVDAFSPYTAIMGRPWLHSLGVVSSTLHQKVKYPSGGQVLEIVGSQSMARQCLVAAIQHKPKSGTSATNENDLEQLETPAALFNGSADEVKCEDLDKVVIRDDSERFFQVGAQLPLQEKEQSVEFLRRNVDVLAWDAYEASRLDPRFICHHLKAATSAPL